MQMLRRGRVALAFGPIVTLSTAAALAQDSGEIEEVVVTGSYIPRISQFDAPAPLTRITSEDLRALGANEIGRVIENLTINTGSQNNPDAFTQNFSTGTSNINLRGLGVSSTLVMLNGRRQTHSAVATDRGENFVDTSSLPPLIAFDRIEILKDGATSLYGSEAVAGVANFITRSDFVGIDLEASYSTTTGNSQDDKQVSLLWGGGSDRTHALVAFSYLDREPLLTSERRLSTQSDDLSQAGNPGSFLVPLQPGHPVYAAVWRAAFDSNLNGIADAIEPQLGLPPVPGAQLPVFADRDCTAIAANDPTVVPTIAASVPTPIGPIPIGLCQFDFGSFYSLVPEEERATGYFELLHDFDAGLRLRVELHTANNEARRNNSPSFPFAALPTIPAGHPDNPFLTNVSFIGRAIGAGGSSSPSVHESDTTRLAVSLQGDLHDRWSWDVGVTRSVNDFSVAAEDVLIDRFTLALRGLAGAGCDPSTGTPGTGSCLYFNPFGSALTGTGTANTPALFADIIGQFSYQATSDLNTLDGFMTGFTDMELGGGPIGVAFGLQMRDESIEYDYDPNSNAGNFFFFASNPDFSGSRNVHAVFAEAVLPVTEELEIQLAARYEDYGGGIDSADPKINLLWRPSLKLSVRAAVGTSFRAPSLSQDFGVQTTLHELIDPRVGIPQFFPVRAQPNPSGARLKPEQADVLTAGVSWSVTDATELNVDYWSFNYDDVIIQQNAQAILNAAAGGDPQAQSQVIRDPLSGLLLRVDSYYANASTLETDGFDVGVVHTHDLARSGGELRFGIDATWITSYDIVDPQAGAIDGLGRRNFGNFATSTPELRANLFASWAYRNQHADVFVRYIDGYVDDEVEFGQGPADFASVGSHTTIDAQYSFKVGGERGPLLSVGAVNLLDEDPPHVATNGGYDSKVHDPRGRIVYLRAGFEF